MNKSYRIVWNHVRNCLMVVSEATKSRGKGASNLVAETVAAAVLALGAAGSPVVGGLGVGLTESLVVPGAVALATGFLANDANAQVVQTITGSVAAPYTVTVGNSLTILSSGTVTGSTIGVGMQSGGFLSNAGTVSVGTLLATVSIGGASGQYTLSGGVNNTGYIANTTRWVGGSLYPTAIQISHAAISGAVQNSGTIALMSGGRGLVVNASTLAGGITNTGLLGKYIDSGSAGSNKAVIIDSSSISGIYNAGTVGDAVGQSGFIVYGSTIGPIINAGFISSWANNANYSLSVQNSHLSDVSNTGIMGAIVLSGSVLDGSLYSSSQLASAMGPNYAVLLNSASTITGSIVNTGNMGMVTIGGSGGASLISGNVVNQTAGTISSLTVLNGSSVVGNVSNAGNLGLISVSGAAVGNIGNAASGTINGVTLNNAAVSAGISNSGVMTASGTAVAIAGGTFGGIVTNAGTIQGGSTGVGLSISTVSGLNQITNTGLIAAQNTVAAGLVLSGQSAPFVINNSGTIMGGAGAYGVQPGYGISASGMAFLTISNSGNIAGISIANSTVQGAVSDNTATVGGNVNIVNSSIGGTMTNAGYYGGDYFISNSTFAGGIRNLQTATVMGTYTVQNGTIHGDVLNEGLVGGGLVLNGVSLVGNVSNTVSGILWVGAGTGQTAIKLAGSTLNGGITNSGLISAGGGWLSGNGIIVQSSYLSQSIVNTGTFSSGQGRVSLPIGVSNSTIAGNINNAGYIDSGNYTALKVNNSSVAGGITNTGYLGGSTGFSVRGSTVSGALYNAGTIAGFTGIGVQGSSVSAGVTNTGSIRNIRVASSNLGAGIYNAGSAVSLNISQNSYVLGDVSNSGTLVGSSYGKSINITGGAVVSGVLNSSGSISGRTGIYVAQGSQIAGISNSGVISATGSAVLINSAAVNGGLVNHGLIQGAVGLDLIYANVQGAIVNAAGASIVGGTGMWFYQSTVSGGLTNSGLIYGTGGVAVTSSGTALTLYNNATGTVVGAISGQLDVSNSGLLSLQTSTGLQTGSHVASTIDGNYYQASTGQLRIGVTGSSAQGTISGNYSTLSVSGTAQFAGTGKIFVDFAAGSQAIQVGQTITGVVTAGTLTASSFSILDNSAVVNFQWQTVGGTLNLVAVSSVIICGSTVSGAQSGPCQMDASNYPNLTVTSLGSISGGSQGVQVLAANITGRLMNSGSILGNSTGVQFVSGATLSGGVTNAGLISGAAGIVYQASVSGGALVNQAGASIVGTSGAGVSVAGSALVSSIANAGYISSVNNAGSIGGVNNTGSVGSVVNSGTVNTVANTGTINSLGNLGSIAGLSNNGSLVSLNNSGTMSGVVQSSGLLTGLTNSGLINAATGVGVIGGTLSSLTNTGSIIGSGMGVVVSNGGSLAGLNNQGYISGLSNVGAVSSIANSGSIASLSNNGTLTSLANSGTMSGVVQAGGVMTGLTNSGLISGTTGVGVIGGTLSSLTNTGSIIGSGMGVVVSNGASLTGLNNQGYISGLNNAGATASLVNSGSIASVANSGTLNSLANTGTIVSVNNTGALSSLVNTGAISNGVTNAGLIGGSAVAITASGSAFTLVNQAAGTIVGAINGTVNVSNSGIIALQSAYNGTTYAGSPVNASISGNYSQAASGVLQLGLTNTGSLNYSHLSVSGTASFAANSTINVVMSSASAITGGQTLAGIVTAGSLVSSSLNIVDNSALVNFRYVTVGGSLSLVAFNTPNCGSVVGTAQLGACEVGVGIPSLTVTGLGTIYGGTQGINVLAANLTGRIINQGTVQGTATGIRFLAGGTLSGGVTNTGLIQGLGLLGVIVNNASVGGIANNGGTITAQGQGVSATNGAIISRGLTNSGLITSTSPSAPGAAGVYLNAATLSGGLLNSGRITSSGTAIVLAANAQLQGGLTNTGSIVGGGSPALYITGSTLSGVLSNSAYMAGISLKSASLIANGINNSGLLSLATAISVANNSTIAGGITNSGTILGNGNYGISLGRSSALMGGVTNLAGATIVGAMTGISLSRYSVVSGISNAGLIMGNNVAGAAIGLSRSTIAGELNNTGSIVSSGAYALTLDQTSAVLGVVNNDHGYISGINNAGSMGGLHNYTGVIANGIVNSGTIAATQLAVHVYHGTVTGGFTNTGLIQATSSFAGVEFYASQLTDSFNNLGGTIAGGLGGSAAFALHSGTTITGVISNTGMITGQKGLSLTASVITGGVTNSGSIMGTNGAGVLVAVNTTLSGLNNTGYVSSVSNAGLLSALNNSGSLGGVSNTGVLSSLSNTGTISNINNSGTLTSLVNSGAISNGVTNAGLIYNASGMGVTASGATITVVNASAGTLVGQFGGTLDVSNSGLIALQTMSGSSIVAGSHINATISGNYVQSSGGTLQIGINGSSGSGTTSGNYSVLDVGGVANLTGGYIYASTNQNNAVLVGQTVAGIINSTGLMTVASGVTVRDNNSTLDYQWVTSGGTLSLVAIQQVAPICNATVTGTQQGPCQVGANSLTSLLVATAGSISGGTLGIQVMATTSGSIVNLGTVIGSLTGVWMTPGATLTGGLSNTGLIQGLSTAGVVLASSGGVSSSLQGGLNNAGGTITGLHTGLAITAGAQLSGGLTNTGMISGTSTAGVLLTGGSSLLGGLNNQSSGTISAAANGLVLNASTLVGGLTNAGLITGTSAAGIALTGSSTINGGLSNEANATISGGVTGLSVAATSALNGGLTNAGLITGGTYAINAPSLTSIVTNGANASFGGTVSAAQATLNVASGTLTATNGVIVNTVTVSSGSQLNLVSSNASSLSGGITATNGVTNSGAVNVGMANATITGNYVQNAGGVLQIGALNPNSHGSLNVTGLASFAPSASIYITTITGGTFANGSTLAGLVNAGTLSATTFTVTSNSSLLNFTASVVGNSVGVTAQVSNTTSIPSATAAQGNVAGAGAANSLQTVFNSFVAGSSTYASMNNAMSAFANMSNDQQISQAVSQSLPSLSSNTPLQTLAVLSAINQSIEARSLQLRGVSSGHELYGNNKVWMKPFGSWMNQGNMNGAYGFKANAGGLMLGGDHQWDDSFRLGGAFAWGNSSANSNMGGQNQTSNMYQFVGYGAYALAPSVNVNLQANGGWNNNTSNRQIGFLGTSAQASYDSAVWHAGVGIDRPTPLTEQMTFIPQARFDYTWIRNQGYSETGATDGMGLNVGSQTYQTSVLGVDGKVQHKLSDHNMVSANLGVGYNFSPTQTWVAASYQGASALQFTTTGVNPSAVMGKAGLGYTYKVKEGVDVGIRYDIDVQEKYTNQIGTAKARWSF